MSDKIKKALSNLYKDISTSCDTFYKDNLKEIIKNSNEKKKKKLKKAIYAGVFLDEGSISELYNWWKLYTKQGLLATKPKNPHMTIAFKPSSEQVLKLPIGETENIKLTVSAVAFDEGNQAVRVRFDEDLFSMDKDAIPHITISYSEDSSAKMSTQCLQDHAVEVTGGPDLYGKVGLFLNNQTVSYDLEGTIYERELSYDESGLLIDLKD